MWASSNRQAVLHAAWRHQIIGSLIARCETLHRGVGLPTRAVTRQDRRVKTFRLWGDSSEVWYILWSAMFLFSFCNALFPDSIFSGNSGFLISAVLAAVAAIQLSRGVTTLSQREADLSATMLIVFEAARLVNWVRLLGPRTVYRGFDFSAYYLAAKVLSKTPGSSIYYLPFYPDGRMNLVAPAPMHSAWHEAASQYHIPFAAPFIYPPFFAALMKPLAHLSFASAFIVWEIITVLLLIGAVLLTFSLAGAHVGRKLALILGVGLFSYFPFRDGLFMGQVSCLIVFLTAAGVWLLSRDRTLLSALSFALATMIKLTPVLALPLLIFHRRWRWLVAYAGWLCAILLFSVSQAGWKVHLQFWNEVIPGISCGSPFYQNSSIVAYVQWLLLGYVPEWGNMPLIVSPFACAMSRLVAITVYLLMLVRFYLRRDHGNLARDLIIMSLLGIVISPIGWWHHFTVALLPFLYFWCKMPNRCDPLLLTLFLTIGTNLVGFSPLFTNNHAVQLILAAIVPVLTIAWVYQCLPPGRKPSTGNFASGLLPLDLSKTSG